MNFTWNGKYLISSEPTGSELIEHHTRAVDCQQDQDILILPGRNILLYEIFSVSTI